MKRLAALMAGGALCGAILGGVAVFIYGDTLGRACHYVGFKLQAAATPIDASGVVSPIYAAQLAAQVRLAAETAELAELRDASADNKAAQRYLADYHGTPKRGR